MSNLLNRVDGDRKPRVLDLADIGTAKASPSCQVFLVQADALATINDVLCHTLSKSHLMALPAAHHRSHAIYVTFVERCPVIRPAETPWQVPRIFQRAPSDNQLRFDLSALQLSVFLVGY